MVAYSAKEHVGNYRVWHVALCTYTYRQHDTPRVSRDKCTTLYKAIQKSLFTDAVAMFSCGHSVHELRNVDSNLNNFRSPSVPLAAVTILATRLLAQPVLHGHTSNIHVR